jgi:hypothetical protein
MDLSGLTFKYYDARYVHAKVAAREEPNIELPPGWELARPLVRYYKYEPGDWFDWHVDPSFNGSTHTFVKCLISPQEGGETEFEDGTLWKHEEGKILIFPHNIRHCGRRVISGVKIIQRADLIAIGDNNGTTTS